MRVLLTGGYGFIAAHCVDILLQKKHSVVFTLSYVIVEGIAKEDAFEQAVQSDPPFEAVLHTASPFHFGVEDSKRLLDPAIIGTTSILHAIKRHAPTVTRAAITSLFAAITNPAGRPETYYELHWNHVTMEDALHTDLGTAYRGSKTFAECAAWDFVAKEEPNFTLTTLCPPLVMVPVVHYLTFLDNLNKSNENVRDLITGKFRKELPPTRVVIWVDAHDLALVHVRAIERDAAAGKRCFVTAGFFRNSDVADIVNRRFPELKEKLPESYEAVPKDFPFDIDNSRSKDVLGLEYRGLEETVVDW